MTNWLPYQSHRLLIRVDCTWPAQEVIVEMVTPRGFAKVRDVESKVVRWIDPQDAAPALLEDLGEWDIRR